MVRAATQVDINYLAAGFAALADLLRRIPDNPFVAELPRGVEASTAIAATFVSDAERFALVAERGGNAVGCLAARVGPAGDGWSQLRVGEIVCCWVEPHARRSQVGRELTSAAEDEFRRRDLDYAELAYLTGNETAHAAWLGLGYTPHRVFSIKRLRS